MPSNEINSIYLRIKSSAPAPYLTYIPHIYEWMRMLIHSKNIVFRILSAVAFATWFLPLYLCRLRAWAIARMIKTETLCVLFGINQRHRRFRRVVFCDLF